MPEKVVALRDKDTGAVVTFHGKRAEDVAAARLADKRFPYERYDAPQPYTAEDARKAARPAAKADKPADKPAEKQG